MIGANKKGQKIMRSICKLALDGMNKTDSNSPILLQKTTSKLFLYYLTTRWNTGGWILSKSSYSGMIGVFVHMYQMIGETVTEEFKNELSQFMSEMKSMVASQNAESGESLDEGKKSMIYEVYNKLCKLLFEGEGYDYTFDHVFLTLECNILV